MSKSAKKAQTPCECANYSILRWNETSEDWDTVATTRCPGTLTTRTFAPGHDAKLKGFLIRAGVAAEEVSDNQGVTANPIAMAARYGFEQMVRKGIAGGLIKRETKKLKKGERSELAEAAQERVDALTHDGNSARKSRELAALVAAEEAKHAAEQAAQAKPLPEPEWGDDAAQATAAREERERDMVKAKVGRWEYEGTVEDGTFTYSNSKGEATSTTKFTLV